MSITIGGATVAGGYTEYPVWFIMENLGLDPCFRGKLLDVGCGRNGNLVEYLRELEIEADGVDTQVRRSAPYLMREDARRMSREDDYYDLAVTHAGPLRVGAYFGLDRNRFFKYISEICYGNAREYLFAVMEEVSRVLKPGGKFIVFPEPRHLFNCDKDMVEKHFHIGVQNVVGGLQTYVSASSEFVHRAVLTKR